MAFFIVFFYTFDYMIGVEKLWYRLVSLGKSGTSGYFTQDEFNSNLYSVQYAILSLLCDNYENNQKVSDALNSHVVPFTGVSLTTGTLFVTSIESSLTEYYRMLSLAYVNGNGEEHTSYKIRVNEISMYTTSAIRKANLSKNRTLWYLAANNIHMLPKEALGYTLFYCKKPAEAKIGFTTTEDEENDYLVVDPLTTVDIDFPEGLFNLFVYYMLESMGIEQKENLALEYSQLGINRTVQTDLK